MKPTENLQTIRERSALSVASLPQETRSLENPISVKVEIFEIKNEYKTSSLLIDSLLI